VANPTLNRFFSLHYGLPFLMLGGIGWHLSILHTDGSTTDDEEKASLFYLYFIKDLFVFIVLMEVYAVLVFFYPNFFSHPDNYIIASVTNTPHHLVPE